MNELVLALSGTAMLALVFLAIPIIRLRHGELALNEKQGLTEQQKAIYQEKSKELEADLAQGVCTQAHFDSAYKELKEELLLALKQGKAGKGEFKHGNLLLLLPLVIIFASIGVYWAQGKTEKMQTWIEATDSTGELGKKIVYGDGKDVTQRDLGLFYLGLRSTLVDKPDDAVGWLLLGRVSAARNDFGAALPAFKKSLSLEPENTGTMLSYAQALLNSHDQNNMNEATTWLRKVILKEPQNVEAIMMLGFVEGQLGNNEIAQQIWRHALKMLPEGDERAAAIRDVLPEYAGQAKKPHSATDMATTASESPKEVGDDVFPQLKIDLSQLSAQAKAYKFAFVFARPARKGPPYAVKRLDLRDGFPSQIRLSDADAMMPSMKLSSLANAFVTVRFSHDQDVMKAANDLEFNMDNVAVKKDGLTEITFAGQ